MISEVEFVIQWIMAGRNQDARCRADRTGTYTLDLKLIEAVVPNRVASEERKLTADEQWFLTDMMANLTKRKEDVFKLVKAESIELYTDAQGRSKWRLRQTGPAAPSV
jgi:positive control factor